MTLAKSNRDHLNTKSDNEMKLTLCVCVKDLRPQHYSWIIVTDRFTTPDGLWVPEPMVPRHVVLNSVVSKSLVLNLDMSIPCKSSDIGWMFYQILRHNDTSYVTRGGKMRRKSHFQK